MGAKSVRAPSGTPATAVLTAQSIPYNVHTYRHEPSAASYALEAAQMLDVEPGRVFKTLLAGIDGTSPSQSCP